MLSKKVTDKISSGETSLNCLLVKKASKKVMELFIDTGVYTISRCFRLVLSAKVKDVCKRHLHLYCSNTETCLPNQFLTKKIFLSSLASFPSEQEARQIIDFSVLQPAK